MIENKEIKQKQADLNKSVLRATKELKECFQNHELLQLLHDRTIQTSLMGIMSCLQALQNEVNWRFENQTNSKE